jgi:hypothetical protein
MNTRADRQSFQSLWSVIQNSRSSIAQSWSLFLTRENGQLMTKCDVFQGYLPVTTEDKNEESKRQQK